MPKLLDNILHLPEYRVKNIKEMDGWLHFQVDAPDPVACKECGVQGEFVRFCKRDVPYRDLPIHGKRVTLWVIRRQYTCRACNTTFNYVAGIGELYLNRRYRCILTNIEEKTLLDRLPTRHQDVVTNYLMKMKDRQKVEIVSMTCGIPTGQRSRPCCHRLVLWSISSMWYAWPTMPWRRYARASGKS